MKVSESKIQTPSQVKDESYLKKIIEDQESSNFTRKEYCHKHQVNYDNFGYWWRKLKRKSVKLLISIKIKSESTQNSGKHIALSIYNLQMVHIYIFMIKKFYK